VERARRSIKHVPDDYTFAEGCIAWGVVGVSGIGFVTILLLGVM